MYFLHYLNILFSPGREKIEKDLENCITLKSSALSRELMTSGLVSTNTATDKMYYTTRTIWTYLLAKVCLGNNCLSYRILVASEKRLRYEVCKRFCRIYLHSKNFWHNMFAIRIEGKFFFQYIHLSCEFYCKCSYTKQELFLLSGTLLISPSTICHVDMNCV